MEELPHALQLWNNDVRTSLPAALYVWLTFMILTYLASLFFVRRERGARWVIVGVIASHSLVAVLELGEFATMRKGLVSLTHVLCWTPALVAVARGLAATSRETRYGVWCRLLVAVMTIALIFDARDAGMYLYYWITGHPVFS